MTVYTISNPSVNSIDPYKQPLQHVPTYTSQVQTQAPPSAEAQRAHPTMGERFHKLSSMAGWPLNKAANMVGAEGWWPSSMDKECLKAARILHSFTKLSDPSPSKANGPMHPTGLTRKSMIKIPQSVLNNCAGLAIFNVIRAGGGHGSLSGGSGVVIARRPDGTWSPPSSFVITTLGAGIMFGLNIYDCVCVLNTQAQVDAFAKPRVSLGSDASVTVGPVGTGGHVEAAVSKTARPMWSYTKSRGLWAGVQIDGTVVVARGDANAVFYGERGITAKRILQGDVAWPLGAKPLFEVLMAVDGRQEEDINRAVLPSYVAEPTPGDGVLEVKQTLTTYAEVPQHEHPLINDEKNKEDEAASTQIGFYESAEEEKARLAKSSV